jgi:hypothetical protein
MINELVKRLSTNRHEVILGSRDESDEEIKQRIRDGYIHIKFTQTKGGTELGVEIDLKYTNIKELDMDIKSLFHIEGITNINYNSVRCIADIDFETRKGEGYLQVI